ncbi:MAG: sugar phosphate isomerase/epimerase [Clostridiales bacterium]|nr:sugar phosphate isomerase/epimerase [Clostridiales bacterium]
MVSIALQLYSIRTDMEQDFEGSLKKVAALGYDGVEFAGLFDKSPKAVKEMLTRAGLIAMGAHVPFAEMMAAPESVLAGYAEIGCKYVAIPYLMEEYRPGGEKFNEVIQGAATLGKIAKDLGMTLLYHNHDFEFVKLDGKYALDLLYETVPADLLQTEIDTCWVKVVGVDPAEYVKKYAGRAPVVHLKDFYKSGEVTNMYQLIGIASGEDKPTGTFEFRPVGSGMQDFPAIMEAARYAGASWVVVEQDLPSMGKTALECAEMSINYLKGLK